MGYARSPSLLLLLFANNNVVVVPFVLFSYLDKRQEKLRTEAAEASTWSRSTSETLTTDGYYEVGCVGTCSIKQWKLSIGEREKVSIWYLYICHFFYNERICVLFLFFLLVVRRKDLWFRSVIKDFEKYFIKRYMSLFILVKRTFNSLRCRSWLRSCSSLEGSVIKISEKYFIKRYVSFYSSKKNFQLTAL